MTSISTPELVQIQIDMSDIEKEKPIPLMPIKEKDYRVKNNAWFCKHCKVFCNSFEQFQIHNLSQKHLSVADPENKAEIIIREPDVEKKSFSIDEIGRNHVAKNEQIEAMKYLIPADMELKEKFEKFGFYCDKCKVFMTGQIQLIMHVKGSKHYQKVPDEVPGYECKKSLKQSNKRRGKNQHHVGSISSASSQDDTKSYDGNKSDSIIGNHDEISDCESQDSSLNHQPQQQQLPMRMEPIFYTGGQFQYQAPPLQLPLYNTLPQHPMVQYGPGQGAHFFLPPMYPVPVVYYPVAFY